MTDNNENQEECGKDGCTKNAAECNQDPSACLSNSSFTGKASNGENMDDCMGRSLDQLSRAFTASARRWELMVYPSLVAFIILAGYGFFLIYSLTKDVHLVVQDMHKITSSMERVVVNMDTISKNMVVMTQTVDNQSASMREMVYHVRGMNMSMNQMRHDMSNVSRPMSFMNDFLPW